MLGRAACGGDIFVESAGGMSDCLAARRFGVRGPRLLSLQFLLQSWTPADAESGDGLGNPDHVGLQRVELLFGRTLSEVFASCRLVELVVAVECDAAASVRGRLVFGFPIQVYADERGQACTTPAAPELHPC